MSRSVRQRLGDIVAAIDAIAAHEERLDGVGIDRSEPVRLDAIVRQLAIVGEAATHMPDAVTDTEPGIEWKRIRGIRIVLDHGYHRIDPSIIWDTIDSDLVPLRDAVNRILRSLNPDSDGCPPR